MPSIVFSHRYILKTQEYKFMIPVRFYNPQQDSRSDVWLCLLDTGAHTSVLPPDLVRSAGHDLLNGKSVRSLEAAWGDSRQTYHHTFIPEIMGSDFSTVLYSLPEMQFDCTDGEHHDPILGADNFLKYFRCEFDYPNETVTLHW
ncbi:MAG: retropepsin-like aspartic protease [Verrucomicrobiota bacterium]